jgi:hypothetical protein
VRELQGRPATGSLIVTHEGTTDDLIEAATTAGLFLVEEATEAHAPSFEAAAWKARADKFLKESFGSEIDLRTVTALAFFAMALRQLAAGSIMPPAATAFWYGFSILLGAGVAGASPDAEADGGDGGE